MAWIDPQALAVAGETAAAALATGESIPEWAKLIMQQAAEQRQAEQRQAEERSQGWICPYCGRPTAPLAYHEPGDCPSATESEHDIAEDES